MNEREVKRLVYIVTAAYPMHFGKYGATELRNLTDAWLAVLGDFTYAEAQVGLKAYLATDKKGFPPSVGQIVDKIVTIATSDTLEPMDAWAMVRRAARNGSYGAEEEFERLPEEVKEVVGDPSNIRAMASMTPDAIESVEKSHFLRNSEALQKRRKEEARLPAQIRELINARKQEAANQLSDGSGHGEALRLEGTPGEAVHDAERLLLGAVNKTRGRAAGE